MAKPRPAKGFSRMPFQRLIATAALFAALLAIAPAHAVERTVPTPAVAPLLAPLPLANLAPALANATLPADPAALVAASTTDEGPADEASRLRQALVALA